MYKTLAEQFGMVDPSVDVRVCANLFVSVRQTNNIAHFLTWQGFSLPWVIGGHSERRTLKAAAIDGKPRLTMVLGATLDHRGSRTRCLAGQPACWPRAHPCLPWRHPAGGAIRTLVLGNKTPTRAGARIANVHASTHRWRKGELLTRRPAARRRPAQ